MYSNFFSTSSKLKRRFLAGGAAIAVATAVSMASFNFVQAVEYDSSAKPSHDAFQDLAGDTTVTADENLYISITGDAPDPVPVYGAVIRAFNSQTDDDNDLTIEFSSDYSHEIKVSDDNGFSGFRFENVNIILGKKLEAEETSTDTYSGNLYITNNTFPADGETQNDIFLGILADFNLYGNSEFSIESNYAGEFRSAVLNINALDYEPAVDGVQPLISNDIASIINVTGGILFAPESVVLGGTNAEVNIGRVFNEELGKWLGYVNTNSISSYNSATHGYTSVADDSMKIAITGGQALTGTNNFWNKGKTDGSDFNRDYSPSSDDTGYYKFQDFNTAFNDNNANPANDKALLENYLYSNYNIEGYEPTTIAAIGDKISSSISKLEVSNSSYGSLLVGDTSGIDRVEGYADRDTLDVYLSGDSIFDGYGIFTTGSDISLTLRNGLSLSADSDSHPSTYGNIFTLALGQKESQVGDYTIATQGDAEDESIFESRNLLSVSKANVVTAGPGNYLYTVKHGTVAASSTVANYADAYDSTITSQYSADATDLESGQLTIVNYNLKAYADNYISQYGGEGSEILIGSVIENQVATTITDSDGTKWSNAELSKINPIANSLNITIAGQGDIRIEGREGAEFFANDEISDEEQQALDTVERAIKIAYDKWVAGDDDGESEYEQAITAYNVLLKRGTRASIDTTVKNYDYTDYNDQTVENSLDDAVPYELSTRENVYTKVNIDLQADSGGLYLDNRDRSVGAVSLGNNDDVISVAKGSDGIIIEQGYIGTSVSERSRAISMGSEDNDLFKVGTTTPVTFDGLIEYDTDGTLASSVAEYPEYRQNVATVDLGDQGFDTLEFTQDMTLDANGYSWDEFIEDDGSFNSLFTNFTDVELVRIDDGVSLTLESASFSAPTYNNVLESVSTAGVSFDDEQLFALEGTDATIILGSDSESGNYFADDLSTATRLSEENGAYIDKSVNTVSTPWSEAFNELGILSEETLALLREQDEQYLHDVSFDTDLQARVKEAIEGVLISDATAGDNLVAALQSYYDAIPDSQLSANDKALLKDFLRYDFTTINEDSTDEEVDAALLALRARIATVTAAGGDTADNDLIANYFNNTDNDAAIKDFLKTNHDPSLIATYEAEVQGQKKSVFIVGGYGSEDLVAPSGTVVVNEDLVMTSLNLLGDASVSVDDRLEAFGDNDNKGFVDGVVYVTNINKVQINSGNRVFLDTSSDVDGYFDSVISDQDVAFFELAAGTAGNRTILELGYVNLGSYVQGAENTEIIVNDKLYLLNGSEGAVQTALAAKYNKADEDGITVIDGDIIDVNFITVRPDAKLQINGDVSVDRELRNYDTKIRLEAKTTQIEEAVEAVEAVDEVLDEDGAVETAEVLAVAGQSAVYTYQDAEIEFSGGVEGITEIELVNLDVESEAVNTAHVVKFSNAVFGEETLNIYASSVLSGYSSTTINAVEDVNFDIDTTRTSKETEQSDYESKQSSYDSSIEAQATARANAQTLISDFELPDYNEETYGEIDEPTATGTNQEQIADVLGQLKQKYEDKVNALEIYTDVVVYRTNFSLDDGAPSSTTNEEFQDKFEAVVASLKDIYAETADKNKEAAQDRFFDPAGNAVTGTGNVVVVDTQLDLLDEDLLEYQTALTALNDAEGDEAVADAQTALEAVANRFTARVLNFVNVMEDRSLDFVAAERSADETFITEAATLVEPLAALRERLATVRNAIFPDGSTDIENALALLESDESELTPEQVTALAELDTIKDEIARLEALIEYYEALQGENYAGATNNNVIFTGKSKANVALNYQGNLTIGEQTSGENLSNDQLLAIANMTFDEIVDADDFNSYDYIDLTVKDLASNLDVSHLKNLTVNPNAILRLREDSDSGIQVDETVLNGSLILDGTLSTASLELNAPVLLAQTDSKILVRKSAESTLTYGNGASVNYLLGIVGSSYDSGSVDANKLRASDGSILQLNVVRQTERDAENNVMGALIASSTNEQLVTLFSFDNEGADSVTLANDIIANSEIETGYVGTRFVLNEEGDRLNIDLAIDAIEIPDSFAGNAVLEQDFQAIITVAADNNLRGNIRSIIGDLLIYNDLIEESGKEENGYGYTVSNPLEVTYDSARKSAPDLRDIHNAMIDNLGFAEQYDKSRKPGEPLNVSREGTSYLTNKDIVQTYEDFVEELIPDVNTGSTVIHSLVDNMVSNAISDRAVDKIGSLGVSTGDDVVYDGQSYYNDGNNNLWSTFSYVNGSDDPYASFTGHEYELLNSVFGYDRTFYTSGDNAALVGVYVGMFRADLTDLGEASLDTELDGLTFGIYGAYEIKNFLINVSGSYTSLERSYDRQFEGDIARGETDGNAMSAKVAVSYDVFPHIVSNSNGFAQITASASYNRLKFDAYNESGDLQEASLKLKETEETTMKLGLGIKLGTSQDIDFAESVVKITPYVKAGAVYSFIDDASEVGMSFNYANAAEFKLDAVNYEGFSYNIGAGINFELNDTLYMTADYEYWLRRSESTTRGRDHVFSGKVGYRF